VLVSLPSNYAGLFALRSTETHPRLITKTPDDSGRKVVSRTLESGDLLKGRISPRSDVGRKAGSGVVLRPESATPPAWVNVRTTSDRVEVWL